jgi:hypothetical protein
MGVERLYGSTVIPHRHARGDHASSSSPLLNKCHGGAGCGHPVDDCIVSRLSMSTTHQQATLLDALARV